MKTSSKLSYSLLFLTAFAAQAHALELHLPGLKKSEMMPEKYVYDGFGCSGQNISPEIEWSKAPEGTKEYALTLYDPDAPTGSGWWHWVVYNIPADVTRLAAGAGNLSSQAPLPKGAIQARTDFGQNTYGGPCPPKGNKPHRYIFTLYALKEKLSVPSDASPAMIGFNIKQNELSNAQFQIRYGR